MYCRYGTTFVISFVFTKWVYLTYINHYVVAALVAKTILPGAHLTSYGSAVIIVPTIIDFIDIHLLDETLK